MTRRTRSWVVVAVAAACAGGAFLLGGSPGPASAQVTIPSLFTTTTAAPPPTTEPPATTAPTTEPPTTAPTTEPPTTEAPPPTTEAPLTTLDTTPTSAPPTTGEPPATTPPTTAPAEKPAAPITAAVIGSYSTISLSVLLFAAVLIGMATYARSLTVRPARSLDRGGTSVTDASRRWRLLVGFGCLALAAVVGLVGYLKLSLEPQVNRQIPYLASAGMALVVLSAIGGSLVVGEQLKADTRRIEQLEEAVARLAEIVAPEVEEPARRRPRRARGGAGGGAGGAAE